MKIKMRCLICEAEGVVDVSPIKYGELEVVQVPDCYCARCKVLVSQIVDGAAEKDGG
jgi:hypothetical protein